MDTIRWQTAQNVCDEETKYKAVVMYLPFVSRCHLKDRITLLMYARTEKTGERLQEFFAPSHRRKSAASNVFGRWRIMIVRARRLFASDCRFLASF